MYSHTELVALQQKAEAARAGMREIDQAAGDNALTEEQQAQFNAYEKELVGINARVDRMNRQNALDADFDAQMRQTSPDLLRPIAEGEALIRDVVDEDKMLAQGEEWLCENMQAANALWGDTAASAGGVVRPWTRAEKLAATPQYRDAFWRLQALGDPSGSKLINEVRADLQVDSDTQAGELVAPMAFTQGILRARDQANVLARNATRINVRQARSLGIRKRTSKFSSYQRGTELQEPTNDTSLAYGAKELHPHDWCSEGRVSRNLIAQSAIGIEAELIREAGIDIAEGKEAELAQGTGNNEYLGLFFPSADGISTARDFGASSNTATAPTFDGLKDTFYEMFRYWGSGLRWYAHPDFYKAVDKITASTGELIWRPSVREGEPTTLFGRPIEMCEAAPSTFSANQYVALLADMSYYYIATSIVMTVQRLVEERARQNQVVFIMRGKDDGMPVLEEGFARVKLGS